MPGNGATVMRSPRAKKRVLFVCHHNQVRSATAEQVCRGRADLEVRSAGVAEYAAVPLTGDLFEWADVVFVFSKRQQRIVEARFGDRPDRKRLVCLRLPDRFEYKSPELISKLTGKLRPYLGPPADDQWASAARSPTPRVAERSHFSRNSNITSPLGNIFSQFRSLFSGAKALRAEPSAY